MASPEVVATRAFTLASRTRVVPQAPVGPAKVAATLLPCRAVSALSPLSTIHDPAIRPQLLLKLERGWRLEATGRLVSPYGEAIPLAGLPEGSELQSVLPGSPGERASSAERELRRFVRVLLPSGVDAEDVLSPADAWPGVNGACVATRPFMA